MQWRGFREVTYNGTTYTMVAGTTDATIRSRENDNLTNFVGGPLD